MVWYRKVENHWPILVLSAHTGQVPGCRCRLNGCSGNSVDIGFCHCTLAARVPFTLPPQCPREVTSSLSPFPPVSFYNSKPICISIIPNCIPWRRNDQSESCRPGPVFMVHLVWDLLSHPHYSKGFRFPQSSALCHHTFVPWFPIPVFGLTFP